MADSEHSQIVFSLFHTSFPPNLDNKEKASILFSAQVQHSVILNPFIM